METNLTYTVTLADGTEITDLGLNGNNFISQKEIDSSVFDGNLSTVTVSDGETTTTYSNMKLIHLTHYEKLAEYWFALEEMTSTELEKIKMQSDIEYVAMMAGVEL